MRELWALNFLISPASDIEEREGEVQGRERKNDRNREMVEGKREEE